MHRCLLTLLLVLLALPARADLEVLSLRHRTVDQVLPTLQGFVEPGGAIQGVNGQIIVRASGQNIAGLRRVLESIDTPARRLLISVTQDAATATRDAGAGVGVRATGERGSTVVVAGARTLSADGRISQQVQALEGSPATISTGTAVPTPVVVYGPGGTVASTAYTQFDTGFLVTPRLAGDRVFLDIAPQRASVGPGGTAHVQRVATSVAGRLGEWIPLGGVGTEVSASGSSFGIGTTRTATAASGVWVRVELLPQ